MNNRGLFALACLLVLGSACAALAEKPVARIACPEAWPGPEGRGASLLGVQPWQDWRFMIGPWEEAEVVPTVKPDSLQMDCVYAGPTQKLKRRLSMAVPGQPVRCVDKAGRKTASYCDVRPVGSEALGPVVWRMAEPVTERVALNGFSLGMSQDAIRVLAHVQGYDLAEDTSARRLSLTRADTRLNIVLGDTADVSREVILYSNSTEDHRVWHAFERKAILRFGFDWEEETLVRVKPNGIIGKNTWYSDDRRVRVEFWPPTKPGEPASLHLIDMR